MKLTPEEQTQNAAAVKPIFDAASNASPPISPADLAARSGINQSDVYRFRSGSRRPNYETMSKLARVVGLEFVLMPIKNP